MLKRAELRRSGVLFRKCLDRSAIIRDFNVDAAENNLAFEHDRQATLIGGYPNRRFIQSCCVSLLQNILNPRNELKRFDIAGLESDSFLTFHL